LSYSPWAGAISGRTMETAMQIENVQPVELDESEIEAVAGGADGRGANTGVAG